MEPVSHFSATDVVHHVRGLAVHGGHGAGLVGLHHLALLENPQVAQFYTSSFPSIELVRYGQRPAVSYHRRLFKNLRQPWVTGTGHHSTLSLGNDERNGGEGGLVTDTEHYSIHVSLADNFLCCFGAGH